ncbi:hypothetical protein I3271_08435 [Photobacterium leiognathi]|uniref:hypothetical protein n=1 Tax=Photobacterium leiognathi TaxID=553611 RepID=UPI001EE13B7C|nr:hypothetical protein [Photobacterium leiognathi]MCG3884714.1 hypothetical protein [Photobacterium leiognathi]
MNKIFKLKRTVSLVDAAKHLSISLKEDVSVQDVLQFVLDKHIILSARFLEPLYAVTGCENGKDEKIVFGEKVHVIEGIFDLVMVGKVRSAITELYNNKSDCSELIAGGYDGFYLKQNDTYYRLQSTLSLDATENNKPAIEDRLNRLLASKGMTVSDAMDHSNYATLNDDEIDLLIDLSTSLQNELDNEEVIASVECIHLDECCYELVIRTSELTRFIESLQNKKVKMLSEEKILGNKERRTFYRVIRSLCHNCGIDLNERGATATLQKVTDLAGDPLSHETIRKLIINLKND